MNYIHLKHYHTDVKRFEHPLLDGAERYTAKQLDEMAQRVIDGGSPEELILALRKCLSLLVGRYLANWPESEPYVDEMVSEGFVEITRLCQKIPLDIFNRHGILVIATSRAQRAIEDMLNRSRPLSSPSRYTQMELIRKGEDPIYLQSARQLEEVEAEDDYVEDIHPADEGDEFVRDILDAFSQIQPLDDIDVAIMDPANWGRELKEVAEEIGTTKWTVMRRKQRLYQRYLELTEKK